MSYELLKVCNILLGNATINSNFVFKAHAHVCTLDT